MNADRANPLRVLIIAPSLTRHDIGEVEWAFHWTEALSRRANVTVLATSRRDLPPLEQQLPMARVITWPEPTFLYQKLERFNAMAKPFWPLFARQVKRWLRTELARGTSFDIAHQILPQAMRHASPLRDTGIPYVIGPLGGGLDTPAAFRDEVRHGSSFLSRLRAIDDFRLRHDRALRASYAGADLVLGVAPYVEKRLAPVGIRRFEAVLERGHGSFPPARDRQGVPDRCRLLHVGRVIRTKGLRDTIRALALLHDLPEVTLTSAGDGPDLAACKAEARALGVADRVTFLGKIPRDRVEDEYARADVFCFPSFREPMGGVFFEAMAHGLPVITAARGGPDFIINDDSGLRLPVETPEQFASDLAAAIRRLSGDPALRQDLGRGARARLESFGSWEDKADTMIDLYHEVLAARSRGAA